MGKSYRQTLNSSYLFSISSPKLKQPNDIILSYNYKFVKGKQLPIFKNHLSNP